MIKAIRIWLIKRLVGKDIAVVANSKVEGTILPKYSMTTLIHNNIFVPHPLDPNPVAIAIEGSDHS